VTQNKSSAVMQQRAEAHDSLDDFPTPPWATRALIEHVIIPAMATPTARLRLKDMTATDPACNRGYMARPLAEYFGVVRASDIHDYGWPGQEQVQDFLFPGPLPPSQWIITNPPFRLAEQFINRAFDAPGWRGTAMLVRTSFLEGMDRYHDLFSKRPPSIVAQFAERVIMHKGILRDPSKEYFDAATGTMKRPSTATSYCWLVWRYENNGSRDTRMVWIPPCRILLERAGDYPPPTERPHDHDDGRSDQAV